MWISNFASSAGVAAALSVQVASLLPVFAEPLPRALLLIGVYGALFALNAFGVKLGAGAITALAALKLTPLFLLSAIGLWFVDWSQVSFAIGDVPSWGALGAGMVLVMFAYSGMETALIPSGELRDPARNVPRATMAAILLVVLLYLSLQIVCQGLLGPSLATSGVPIADTAGALVVARPHRVAGHRLHLDDRVPDGQPARHVAAAVRARPRRLPAACLWPGQRERIACRCWRWPRTPALRWRSRSAAASMRWC